MVQQLIIGLSACVFLLKLYLWISDSQKLNGVKHWDYAYVPSVIITIRSFPYSWLINEFVTRVTRRVPHVEQELLTFPEHLSSAPDFSWDRVAWSLVFCAMFCTPLFVLFLLAIAVSVVIRFTASDYPFGIFNLFLWHGIRKCTFSFYSWQK